MQLSTTKQWTEWHIYASVKQAIIGSYYGLPPVLRHVVIWTNVALLFIWSLWNPMEFQYENCQWRKLVWKCRLHNGDKITNTVPSPNSLNPDYAVHKIMISRIYIVCQLLLAKCVRTYIRHVHFASLHDDVIKWKHFPRYWPFVRGIHRSTVNSTHTRPVQRSFEVLFDLCLE